MMIEELERRNRQLTALNQTAAAIAAELSPDRVLQQIVDSARELVGAQFAALGVPNAEGVLETFIYSGMTAEEAALIDHLPRGYGLLGAIVRERVLIRLPNIADDPRSVGFPEGHPLMVDFLGLPIMHGGLPVGNLYLTNKLGGSTFSAEDEELATMLAVYAAIAIQNARLYEQVGRLAVLEERGRIGMDLHDGIIQSIYAVGLTLESSRMALADNPRETEELLGAAIKSLNDAIRDIRNFILDLRPQRFTGDLDEALERLSREFQMNTSLPVTMDIVPTAVHGLPITVARAIFLTTQEALANIARHARATAVSVSIEPVSNEIRLTVADNGRGFNPALAAQATGHGLANMRTRAETLRGSFLLESAVGQGTTIRLQVPRSGNSGVWISL